MARRVENSRKHFYFRIGIIFNKLYHRAGRGHGLIVRQKIRMRRLHEIARDLHAMPEIFLILMRLLILQAEQERRDLFVEFPAERVRDPPEFAELMRGHPVHRVLERLRVAAETHLAERRHRQHAAQRIERLLLQHALLLFVIRLQPHLQDPR